MQKIISVELDNDFVQNLKIDPERTKQMEKEIQTYNKDTRKPAKIKTLNVKKELPDLSKISSKNLDNTKLKDTEGLGVAGNIVDLTLLKSRTSNVGKSIPLIFDHKRGFDAELSLLQLLKDMKMINGAGAYLYFKDRSDMKFSQKLF